MPDKTIYEQLEDILGELKEFLETNFPLVKTGVDALRALGDPVKGRINDLLDLLIELLTKLRTEIQDLDVSNIPGLSEATEFSTKVKTFLETAKTLLPNEAAKIGTALQAADFAAGLPSLTDLKTEIITLITFIVGKVQELRGT